MVFYSTGCLQHLPLFRAVEYCRAVSWATVNCHISSSLSTKYSKQRVYTCKEVFAATFLCSCFIEINDRTSLPLISSIHAFGILFAFLTSKLIWCNQNDANLVLIVTARFPCSMPSLCYRIVTFFSLQT